MKVNAALVKEMRAAIKKDLDIAFGLDDSYQFLIDTINNAGTLNRLQPEMKAVPAGNIEALSVASRKTRLADDSDGDTSTPADGVTKRQIPYAVKKVFWDAWLKNDDVVYNSIRRASSNVGIGYTQEGITPTTNLETAVIQMIQKQFGMDLQDLAFNGDTAAAAASDPAAPFLGIVDGFVKISAGASAVTDLGTDEPTMAAFMAHIALLPEKYKANFGAAITWFIKQSTHDKLAAEISSRQTALGDNVMVEGKITKIGGYNVEIVAALEGPYKNPADYLEGKRGWAALTPWQNLTPVFTQDVKYKRTAEGATAAKKDSTYHILFAYMDVIIKELDGIAIMLGDNL